MELIIKKFSQLSTEELYEILRLRVAVFVVEQNCPYQDIDEADKEAYHLWLRDENGIAAYLRVMDRGVTLPEVSIGRVIAARRRMGLGSRILKEGIALAERELAAEKIMLEAQVYARSLYEKAGFVQSSGEFLEDGIPHILMIREKCKQT